MGEAKNQPKLVDFLYKDSSRIESLFAQMFSGSIREVATTQGVESGSRSNLGASIYAVSGGKSSEQKISEVIEKRIDPHDQSILDLLSALNLPAYDSALPQDITSHIALISGTISIRNYQTIKQAIPLFFSFMKTQDQTKQGKKQLDDSRKMLESMMGFVPMGLEIELVTEGGTSITGPIKAPFLSEDPDDLLVIYGNQIPGRWHCLGIIDSGEPPRSTSNQNSLRGGVDEFAKVLKDMFREGSTHSIIPILVFRELELFVE